MGATKSEQNVVLTEAELEKRFAEALDATYGEVQIAGLEYGTFFALKNLDPIRFRCELADFADSLTQDGFFVDGYC